MAGVVETKLMLVGQEAEEISAYLLETEGMELTYQILMLEMEVLFLFVADMVGLLLILVEALDVMEEVSTFIVGMGVAVVEQAGHQVGVMAGV